jgi:hypothetical protein
MPGIPEGFPQVYASQQTRDRWEGWLARARIARDQALAKVPDADLLTCRERRELGVSRGEGVDLHSYQKYKGEVK